MHLGLLQVQKRNPRRVVVVDRLSSWEDDDSGCYVHLSGDLRGEEKKRRGVYMRDQLPGASRGPRPPRGPGPSCRSFGARLGHLARRRGRPRQADEQAER